MNTMFYIAKVNQLQYTINRINTVTTVLDEKQLKEAITKILLDNSKSIERLNEYADDENYFI